MSTLPDKDLLRVEEVAVYFGVTTRTVYLWIEHGHLKKGKFAGSTRIERESVIAFRLRGWTENGKEDR